MQNAENPTAASDRPHPLLKNNLEFALILVFLLRRRFLSSLAINNVLISRLLGAKCSLRKRYNCAIPPNSAFLFFIIVIKTAVFQGQYDPATKQSKNYSQAQMRRNVVHNVISAPTLSQRKMHLPEKGRVGNHCPQKKKNTALPAMRTELDGLKPDVSRTAMSSLRYYNCARKIRGT